MSLRIALALLALMAAAGCSRAQGLAITVLAAKQSAPIAVTLTSPADSGALAARHSAYGANISPPLAWTAIAGAGAYAVVIEDPDAHGPAPFLHWLIWNIASAALPEGVPKGAVPGRPEGAVQGANGLGDAAYFGPRPPSGVHHYHVEVFALDGPLSLAPGASLAAFEKAALGHVIAKGETSATYAAPRS